MVDGGAAAPAFFWSEATRPLLVRLGSGPAGLSSAEAAALLERVGPNELDRGASLSRLRLLGHQLASPLLLLLLVAAAISALSGEWPDAAIVIAILVASVGIGYLREYRAQAAVQRLRDRVRARTTVVREGVPRMIPLADVVPGDVFLLAAGSLVPADAVVLEAADCYVSEAVLTGESFPALKNPDPVAADAPLARRTNCVFLGTNVRSGTARCVAVHTGHATEYGQVAHRLAARAPETEFDRGIRRFGWLLTSAMLVLVLLVFAAHMWRGRPPGETLLFAVALAVGLSPELLPAVLTVSLARGAELMARRGVLVRHLSAIENLGSMDVLCADKTGTLTEGVVRLNGAFDAAGAESPAVLELAAVNAAFETGLPNPLDDAILAARTPDVTGLAKAGEVPFDFVRKRVTVFVHDEQDGVRLITKGAFAPVLAACARLAGGAPLDAAARAGLEQRVAAWSAQGLRVLAIASRRLATSQHGGRDDERELEFEGCLTFLDRPKAGVRDTLEALAALGVTVKLITGDAGPVARHVASLVGMRADRVLSGEQLQALSDAALWHAAPRTDLFVEVDPMQKERIIRALRSAGHVVGFLGDGVNDAPAMHAADASLAADQAVDVARAAADFVLLERDLDVIRHGIAEGRRTFANTMKYILTTTSANLGNMVSMAAASLFLPFLPLLAGQILLNNFLSDIPAIGIADDAVDPELVARPHRWDLKFIGRFMITFGLLSSLFDALTFGMLLGLFGAGQVLFRTAWFVESLLTELVIALVVRTRRVFYRSRPGTLLLRSTIVLIGLALAIPYLPLVGVLGLVPLPAAVPAALVGITVLYVVAAELVKRLFYARIAGTS